MSINERAASDCKFYGHAFIGQSNCSYCNTPQKGPRANGKEPDQPERGLIGKGANE